MSRELIDKALAARELAIAPYSGFKVGAALKAKDGKVYTGCNIENASYGLTGCAERVALYKALSEGVREFTEIAVVTDATTITHPCGACRQALHEFSRELEVIMDDGKGGVEVTRLAGLLPKAFGPSDLK